MTARTLAERLRESLRLALLRLLAEAGGYTLNASVLTAAARDLGHHEGRDVIEGELDWLERRAMVTLSRPIDGLTIATLTGRGADVAAGVVTESGIARPSPRG